MRIPRRAALSLLASPAFAQSWPNRPLRIIVPFPPVAAWISPPGC